MKKKTMFKTGSRYSALLCVLSMTAGCLTGCGNTVADNKTDVSSAATGTTVVSTTTAENETTAETFDPRAICEGVTLTIAIADNDLVIGVPQSHGNGVGETAGDGQLLLVAEQAFNFLALLF